MPFDNDSDTFLKRAGPLAGTAAECCAGLEGPPDGFER